MRPLPPIPPELAHRPRDRRGLPIPFIVTVGSDGVPNYTANDMHRVVECTERGLCALSGLPMGRDDVWFVGGPQSAYSPVGAYVDPPGKRACLEWALQVCPFLAVPLSAYKPNLRGSEGALTIFDPKVSSEKPPYFVMARCNGYVMIENMTYIPNRPWEEAQHWKGGEVIETPTRATIKKTFEAERLAFKRDNPQVNLPSWQRRLNRGGEAGTFPWAT